MEERMESSSQSFIWEYFDMEEASIAGTATCFKCRKKYRTSGNTSNLRDHLKRVHKIIDTTKNESAKRKHDENIQGTVQSSKKMRLQTLNECISYKNAYGLQDLKRKELNNALISMVAIDMQPFTIVSDPGFRIFVNKLDNRYILPSPNTLKHNFLPQRYNEVKAVLQNMLDGVKYVSLTTDAWTSSYTTDGYVTVTCHFVLHFKLYHYVLETQKVNESHTAQQLADFLQGVINNWGLQNKVACIVTDNAANVKAAITLLKIPHLPCAAHTLNLVVTDTFKNTAEINAILGKCRKIVGRFKRSVVASEMLKKEQAARNLPELKLLQDVSTRWNSVFVMIERILLIKDALLVPLSKLDEAPDNLLKGEYQVLSDVCSVLEPFMEATEQLSGDNYVTSSLIISIFTGICLQLKELKPHTHEGQQFRNDIFQNLVVRFSIYESKNAVARSATILDPRFKKLVFRNKDNALSATAFIQNELTDIFKEKNIQRFADPQPSTSRQVAFNDDIINQENDSDEAQDKLPKARKKKLLMFLQTKTNLLKKTLEPASGVVLLRQYLETPNINLEENPLKYWEDRKDEYEYFTPLVEKYFATPATSVPSERLFSKSGQLLSERRSRLKPKHVNMLLFLNCNSSL